MILFFMKQKALDYMKANISTFYQNYYTQKTNDWVYDLFDYDPFEVFRNVPDFSLIPITSKRTGAVDLQNCKILYNNLKMISESQASDERLWAGLCHSTFYDFVRKRWDYPNKQFKDEKSDVGAALSRFFFSGGIRAGYFRNTIAKYWWVGHSTYDNNYEALDALGPDDLISKISEFFYSYNLSANPNITRGVAMGWKFFSDMGIKLTVKYQMRPALQYLNALGGGIVLDSLSSDEIKEIFVEYLNIVYQGKNAPAITEDTNMDQDEEEEETEETATVKPETKQTVIITKPEPEKPKEEVPQVKHDKPAKVIGNKSEEDIKNSKMKGKIMGIPDAVTYGTTVRVRKPDMTEIVYHIPKTFSSGKYYPIQKVLLDKKLGEMFRFAGTIYRVIDISW